jgi:hypothetical protein
VMKWQAIQKYSRARFLNSWYRLTNPSM